MYFPIIDVLKENFIAKIPSIVTQWLTDNVDPVGSAVVVDTSLSISGAAADAKITGDLKSDLADLNDAFSTQCGEEIIFTSDRYIDTRGSVGSTVNTEMQISGSTKCAIFEINPGEKVFLNGTCPVVKLWAFIDAQNVLLASSPSNYTGVDLIVEAPSGTAKCIVNIRTDRPSGYCTKGIPPYYYGDMLNKLTVSENPLKDKKITLIGDSITEYNYRAKTNWAMWLSDWTGCIVQNLGSNGTGFYRRVPYVNRISSIAQDTKIIGVAVSINDAAEVFEGHIQLGTPADVQSDGTLLGYANTFFDTLLTSFPTTPIIVYVQCPSEDYGFKVGMTNGDAFIQGVKDVCQSYNIPFYTDIYYKGSVLKPWILANRQLYFTSDNDDIGDVGVVDTIHPNSIGHKVIARRLMHRFEDNIVV